jgi:hypothetical protein
VLVGRARCLSQIAETLHDCLWSTASSAPFAQHGHFAKQVHRDFDAVKKLSLRVTGTVKKAFNHALNLSGLAIGVQRKIAKGG